MSKISIHICVDAGVLIFQIYLENHFSIGCNCFSTKWLPFTSFLKHIAAMILMLQQSDTSEPVNTMESRKSVGFDNGIFGFFMNYPCVARYAIPMILFESNFQWGEQVKPTIFNRMLIFDLFFLSTIFLTFFARKGSVESLFLFSFDPFLCAKHSNGLWIV